jgi:hypothetical protein
MTRETLFAALLLVSAVSSYVSLAQEKAELPYPAESDITFQWTYSCPTSQCAFSCPGTGRAKQVTKLTIVMGRMRIGNSDDHNPIALFYEYSTKDIPRGNGFSINGGLGRLACQVSGMRLDYSGPPKSGDRR